MFTYQCWSDLSFVTSYPVIVSFLLFGYFPVLFVCVFYDEAIVHFMFILALQKLNTIVKIIKSLITLLLENKII